MAGPRRILTLPAGSCVVRCRRSRRRVDFTRPPRSSASRPRAALPRVGR
jgi:hypothetical protein